MATYLVTGGCGFIGSHLADALVARGDRVRILDDLSTGKRDNAPGAAELIVGDVGDAATVASAMDGVDGCFHLAAIASVMRSVEDWVGTHRVNLGGAVNVFSAARAGKGGDPLPVVYASSSAVYGNNPDLPLGEDSRTGPLSAYGADKLGCELHGRVAWEIHGIPNTGLRFFNVYGRRQDPSSPYSGVISIFADRLLKGTGIEIHGDGGQVRDFVYVADCVAHILAAMARVADGASVYNVCTGIPTTIADLAGHVARAVGGKPSIAHGPARPGDVRASLGDPAKATAALGVTASTPVSVGLKQFVAALKAVG